MSDNRIEFVISELARVLWEALLEHLGHIVVVALITQTANQRQAAFIAIAILVIIFLLQFEFK
jgi:hypothetical protein